MVLLRIKNIRRTADEYVYNGAAVLEVRSTKSEVSVEMYGSDPQFREGAFALFMSAEKARSIAQDLLQHAAVIEGGRINNQGGKP